VLMLAMTRGRRDNARMSEHPKIVTSEHIDKAVRFFALLRDELGEEEPLARSLEAVLEAGVMKVMYDLGRAAKKPEQNWGGRFRSAYMIGASTMAVASTAQDELSGFPGPFGPSLVWAFETGTPRSTPITIMCDKSYSVVMATGPLEHAVLPDTIDPAERLAAIDAFIGGYFTSVDTVAQVT
jgi:hypothetical protein